MRTFGFGSSLAAIALTAIPACWTAPPDDAGEEAFAFAATVQLLGRNPYNHREVEALAALAAAEGREAVVDVLMTRPEFVKYWSRVLWEDMGLALSDANSEFDERPIDTSCYTQERLSDYHNAALVHHLTYEPWSAPFCPGPVITRGGSSTPSQGDRTVGALAAIVPVDEATRTAELQRLGIGTPRIVASPMEHLATGGIEYGSRSGEGVTVGRGQPVSRLNPAIQSCGSFTLADVAEAALTEDRLDVLYRAGIVSVSTANANAGIAGAKFMKGWLDRDPACLECHSTPYSTTDPRPGNEHWDRYYPTTHVDLEDSAFSYFDDQGDYHFGGNGAGVGPGIDAFFRPDAFQESGGQLPWGIHASCATSDNGVGYASTLPAGDLATLAGLYGDRLGPLQLMDQFALGVSHLDLDALDTELAPFPVLDGVPGNAEDGRVIVEGEDGNGGCQAGCHAPGNTNDAPTDIAAHTRYMTPAKIFEILTRGSGAGLMGPVLGDDAARDVVAYLTSNAAGHYHSRVHTERSAALAHLAALTIVNDVFEEVSGYSLILDHGFPRNEEASATLEFLTREFVAHDWSLKILLKRILLSDAANRRAPANSLQDDRYELPMLYEPYADVNDETPNTAIGEDKNGEGDEVHRYSLHSLLLRVQHALLWPEPPQFPSESASAWADRRFRQDFGGAINFNNGGFPELVLSGLLAWEVEIARCENPGPDPDYVDHLVDPVNGLTVRQAVKGIKERLIGDGGLWDGQIVGSGDGPIVVIEPPPNESATIEQALGVDLDDPASDNEDALRDYCAAVLLSPQFLMGGLAPWDLAHPPPDTDPDLPCVDAECTQTDYCELYRDLAVDLGYGEISCGVQGPGDVTWG